MKQYTLRNGDKGQEVKKLQLAIGNLLADGDFGPATESAVKSYQSSQGLVSDGIAGTKTLTSLEIPVEIGVDLSRHNGDVDFVTMANAGVKYAWIKCTEGTTHVNPGYELKFRQAREAGIQVGGYHFSRPDTYPSLQDAIDESLNFLGALSKVGFYKGDLLPVLDVEAEPERMASLWDEWDVWQWTGSGSVPGVVGKCDINWCSAGMLPALTYHREINICGMI